MVFTPTDRHKIVLNSFPQFTIGRDALRFVAEFKYLGHIISDTLSDDSDIMREVRNMYVRSNILKRRFGCCSNAVKVVLFRSYC